MHAARKAAIFPAYYDMPLSSAEEATLLRIRRDGCQLEAVIADETAVDYAVGMLARCRHDIAP